MSDWKSRAQSIDASPPTNNWRSRATIADNGLPGQPTGSSLGSTDNSAPDSDNVGLLSKALNVISHPLKVLGKVAQYPRDVIAGPATGGIISAIAGKPVFTGQEAMDAYNPLTTSTFPSTHEMLTRGGLSDSPPLSDMLQKIPDDNRSPLLQLAKIAGKHFYADPNKDNPWYQPVKGGAFDPTLASAYDFATNPLNTSSVNSLVSAGEKAPTAANTALQAAENGGNPVEAVLNMLKSPQSHEVEAPSKFLEMGNKLQPSTTLKALGKKLYESLLQPVENQGAKFGKTDVADTLYNAGIKTPLGLSTKAASANNALMEARNALLEKAGQEGGTVSMSSAVSPTESSIADAVASQDPLKGPIAQKIGELTDSYKKIESGTPAIPPKSELVDTGILDSRGKPITDIRETTPGFPEVPGKSVTPMEASGYKTSLYNSLPATQYNEAVKSSFGNNLRAKLANGFKTEVEKSVGKTLGTPASEALTDLNSEAGKLLATPQGQLTAQNNAGRLLNQVVVPTRADAVLAALREGDPSKALMMKHAINALNLGSMPIGYGLRKIAESPAGPMLDMTLRQQLSNQGENQ